jgi:hypothetical protein
MPRSYANPARIHIDVALHSVTCCCRSSVFSFHLDIALHSSLLHHMSWLSVAGVLAKMVVRHRDANALVHLSNEQITEILRR